MDTPSDAVRRLQAEGYTGNWFANRDHELECDETGKRFDPADLEVDHVLRFEGQSDPGDMTILYALRARRVTRGCTRRHTARRCRPRTPTSSPSCRRTTPTAPWAMTDHCVPRPRRPLLAASSLALGRSQSCPVHR